MKRKLKMQPIPELNLLKYENEFKGKIKFDAWYQRPEVWKTSKKQKLIDSIINGYDVGAIYLRRIDNGNYKYEVLDGQQRLRAIDQFIDGEFKTDKKLTPEVGSISYRELKDNNDLSPRWNSFHLHIFEITYGNKRAVADFFLRLQEGMELKTAEILNAIVGEMRTKVIDISEHPFFEKIGISEKRYRHRLLAAQSFKLEIDGDFENRSFPDMRRKTLKKMYKNHRSNVPRRAKNKVKKTLNLLDDIFDDASYIQKQGDFLPIYMLVRYLKENFAIGKHKDKIEDFTKKFLSEVEATEISAIDIPEKRNPFQSYRDGRRAGALSADSFRRRFEAILGKCLENIPNISRKDEQRAFDYGQKLAIYYRDNGVCQQCDKSVKFEEAEFHHKERFEDGGPTIVENGETVHPKCHPR